MQRAGNMACKRIGKVVAWKNGRHYRLCAWGPLRRQLSAQLFMAERGGETG